METLRQEEVREDRRLLRLFDFALVVKAIDGAIELGGAVLVLLVPPAFIIRISEFVTADELSTDPTDLIARTIRELAHSFAVHAHYFLAAYLAFHGLVKILLVIGIFAGKRAAYPLFMASLVIFGVYEAYRAVVLGQTFLLALAFFDGMLLLLAWYEYGRRYPGIPLFSLTPRPDTAQ